MAKNYVMKKNEQGYTMNAMLEESDELDAALVELLHGNHHPGIPEIGVSGKNGTRKITASTALPMTLRQFMNGTMNRVQVLLLLRNISEILLTAVQNFPTKELVLDLDAVFIDPNSLAVNIFACPVNAEKRPLTNEETADFLRNIVSHIFYSANDQDNYVMKVLNAINYQGFDLGQAKGLFEFMVGQQLGNLPPVAYAPAIKPLVEEYESVSSELQPAVSEEEIPVPQPAVSEDEAPVPQPAVSEDEAPVPQPAVSEEKIPVPQPAVSEEEIPVPQPAVSEDEAPVPQPAVSEEEIPVPQPAVSEEKIPVPQPAVSEEKIPVPQPAVSEEEIPVPQPAVSEDEAPASQPDNEEFDPNRFFDRPAGYTEELSSMPGDLPFIARSEQLFTSGFNKQYTQRTNANAQNFPHKTGAEAINEFKFDDNMTFMPEQGSSNANQPMQSAGESFEMPKMNQSDTVPVSQPEISPVQQENVPMQQMRPEMRTSQAAMSPAQASKGNINPNVRGFIIRQRTQERVEIYKPMFMIGKSHQHADYAVEGNPAISRVHAAIMQVQGSYVIKDNNSTNGTFVNDRRLQNGEEIPVTDGTVIRLGNENFTFQIVPR